MRAADCHPERQHKAHGMCDPCYQSAWKIATGRDARTRACLCGCGSPARTDSSYRRGHTPVGYAPATSITGTVASKSFKCDENGVWYYWNARQQKRTYGVKVGTCSGCGTRFLTRQPARDRYCTRSCSARYRTHPSGDKCYQWKGGRSITSGGYVLVKRPEHPAATKRGYVLEHRLVMEARLGRYLLPGENVHHINGVKDDNREENLELWVTVQPSGQRSRDLVNWARKVVEMYSAAAPEEAAA